MDDVVQYSFLTCTNDKPLDGGKYYRFYLPANIPSCNFWSLIVYDSETELIILTDQSWPSVHSNCKGLETNEDGSVDAWFGPEVPPGKEGNFVKTIPGKDWYLILKFYGLKGTCDEKCWRPGEIEEMNQSYLEKQKIEYRKCGLVTIN